MAMEKAIISTTIGAEGLPLQDGKELLLADTEESFANAVIRVLTDKGLASELGNRAAATVRARFGWEGVAEQFASICEETVVRTRTRRPAIMKTQKSEGERRKPAQPIVETR
jgi:glycosyltransferase involved in cell wall biosynthesis